VFIIITRSKDYEEFTDFLNDKVTEHEKTNSTMRGQLADASIAMREASEK
jgi:hypothetical protein